MVAQFAVELRVLCAARHRWRGAAQELASQPAAAWGLERPPRAGDEHMLQDMQLGRGQRCNGAPSKDDDLGKQTCSNVLPFKIKTFAMVN